jgi:predicted Zn-dependent peptidase
MKRRPRRSSFAPGAPVAPERPPRIRAVPRWGESHRRVLGNGVRVVTVPAPRLHSAMLALYVRAGSRHEAAEVNGISHFLEHLFFRGTVRYPDSSGMNLLVEAAGGSLNGITARDHGCYYTPIHGGQLGVGLSVLGDMVRRPLLHDLDLEREVILEEILDEVDARGRDVDADNLSKRLVYPGHPLGFKIGGTPRIVRRLSLAEVRRHHRRFYVGENLVLCVAGPVREAEVAELAEEHLGQLPRGRRSADLPPPAWPEGPVLELVGHEDAQAEFCLNFPCPPEWHPDYPVHLVLRRILDDGLSSRLPLEVVERRGLAYALHAGIDTFSDAGLFVVDGACAPRKLPRLVEEVLRILGDLVARPVSEEELLRVQRRHRTTLAFSLDSAAELAGWYGSGELLEAPESFEERCRRVEAVSPADVQRVAALTYTRANLVAVFVGPSGARARRRLTLAVERSGLP